MSASDIGIAETDFTNNALSDFGRSVTHKVMTKSTNNVTGKASYSQASSTSITAVVWRKGQEFDWAKEGFVEKGDALMLADKDLSIGEGDQIVDGSDTYRVGQVILRRAGDVQLSKTIQLFLDA